MNEIVNNSQYPTVSTGLLSPGVTTNDVLTWNGSSWVSTTFPKELPQTATTNHIIIWNGSTWTAAEIRTALPAGETIGNILVWNGTTWVSSSVPVELSNGNTSGNVLTWNGSAWVSTPYPTELPSGTANNVLRWNGSAWVAAIFLPLLPSGSSNGDVLLYNGSTWAAAAYPAELPAGVSTNNVLTWNGSAWVSSAYPAELPAGVTTNNVLTWNGSAWVSSAPPSGSTTYELASSTTTSTTALDLTKSNSACRGSPNLDWFTRISNNNGSIRNGNSFCTPTGFVVCSNGGSNHVAYNADGSVGITGTITPATLEIWLFHYSKTGTVQWAARTISSAGQMYLPLGTCDMSTGDIYMGCFCAGTGSSSFYSSNGVVFGTTLAAAGGFDINLVKYNSSGIVQWVTRVASVDGDYPAGLSFYNGALYVAGSIKQTASVYNANGTTAFTLSWSSTSDDGALVKYNSSGTGQWGTRVVSTSADSYRGVVVDSSGIYATFSYRAAATLYNAGNVSSGVTLTPAGSFSFALAKYSDAGAILWTARSDLTSGGGGTESLTVTTYNSRIYAICYYQGQNLNVYSANGVKFTTLIPPGASYVTAILTYDTAGNCLAAYNITTNAFLGVYIKATECGLYVNGYYQSSGYLLNSDGTQYPSQLTLAGSNACFYAQYDFDGNVLWVTKTSSSGSCNLNGMDAESTNMYFAGMYDTNPLTMAMPMSGSTLSISKTNGSDLFVGRISTASLFSLANPGSVQYKNITSDALVDGAVMKVTPTTSIYNKSKVYSSFNLLRNGASINLVWGYDQFGANRWYVLSDVDVAYST